MVGNLLLCMPQKRHTCTQEMTQFDRRCQFLRDPGHDALDLTLFGLGQKHAFLTVELNWLRDRGPQLEATELLLRGCTIRPRGVSRRRFFSYSRRPTLPNLQWGNLTLVGNTSLYRRQRKPQNIFRSVVRLVRWAMRSDLIEGDEWEA
jgi:hypothetical protein